jgi:hypothetical protein
LKLPKYTTFTFNEQQQSTAGFSSFNQTMSVNDVRQWKRTSSTVDMTLNHSGGTSGSERETMDVRLSGSRDVSSGIFSLEYQRTIPIGAVTNFFPGADKTPVLTFRSDNTKLFGPDSFKTLPFRTEVSLGEYLDPISKQRFSKASFDYSFSRATRDVGNWKWDFNGDLKQNMFSDSSAQYKITLGSGLTYAIGKKFSVNMRYSSLRPFGYSPLAMDRSGTSDMATMDLSWLKNSKSSFGIQTGYDFVRSGQGDIPWQQVGIRSEYRLGNAFNFRSLSTYDTFRQSRCGSLRRSWRRSAPDTTPMLTRGHPLQLTSTA